MRKCELTLATMISITKFKKLMTCYFVCLFVGSILYLSFHGGSRQHLPLDKHNDNTPHSMDTVGSLHSFENDQEALIGKLDAKLREIASKNALSGETEGKLDFNGSLPSDEELDAMIDALHYALPTHALGLEDIWPNGTATATPDYFLRSIAFTQDYAPSDKGAEEASRVATRTNKSDEIPEYELDRMTGFYEYYDGDEEDTEIPHIIHQTWKTTAVPWQAKYWIPTWSQENPFWMHWFWSEGGLTEMLLRHFPEQFGMYKACGSETTKTDMRKYFLMFKEGGVVADIDVAALRPLDDNLMDNQCILAREPEVHRLLIYNGIFDVMVNPAFMACRAGHPFFKFIVQNIKKLAENPEERNGNSLNSAGTIFLSNCLHQYRKYGPDARDDVYIAPADVFFSTFDPSQVTPLKVKCNGYKLDNTLSISQRNMCESLTYAQFNITQNAGSYTEPHWLGSLNNGVGSGEQTELISSIEPAITLFDR